MTNESGTVWLTFNGEIYNAPALRNELEALGHRFASSTDTEVLVHGYEAWGIEDLLTRIRGMFAFAVYDTETGKLVLARDRFGIKPLVYTQQAENFVFASELKALRADPALTFTLDEAGVRDFLVYSYVPHPKTIYREAKKLPPAHYLTYVPASGELKLHRYWTLATADNHLPPAELLTRFETLLTTALSEHYLSDVPVGLFLSGGYDSSALALLSTRLGHRPAAFSLGFAHSERSEHRQARSVAERLGIAYREEMIPTDDPLLASLQPIYSYYDEPCAVSSLLSYHRVSKLASRTHKVVLAGDGGDELLAGYAWHYTAYRRATGTGWRGIAKRWRERLLGRWLRAHDRSLSGIYPDLVASHLLSPTWETALRRSPYWYFRTHDRPDLPPPQRSQWLDTHTFMLGDCLNRADTSSMYNSLEVRVPFLDHRLFELLYSLRPTDYFRPSVKKWPLHELIKHAVPPEILQMPKRGFSYQHVPALFDERLHARLRNGQAIERGWFRKGTDIERLPVNVKWHWLMLELWLENQHPCK